MSTDLILPEVTNGNKKLVVNQTVCFDPSDGINFRIPAGLDTSGNVIPIDINFRFSPELGEDGKNIEIKMKGRTVRVLLKKFFARIPIGTFKPIPFQIGQIQFHMFFTCYSLDGEGSQDRSMTMTLSLYKEVE